METLKHKILLSNGQKLKVKVEHDETWDCKFVHLYDGFTKVDSSPMYAEWVDIPFILRQMLSFYLSENNVDIIGII